MAIPEWVKHLPGNILYSKNPDGSLRQASNGGDAGTVVIDGLSNNAIRVNATSHPAGYSSTIVLGFRILNPGTGDLTFVPNTLGATPIVITAAEITAMGIVGLDWTDMAASNVLAGAGMELLVRIP